MKRGTLDATGIVQVDDDVPPSLRRGMTPLSVAVEDRFSGEMRWYGERYYYHYPPKKAPKRKGSTATSANPDDPRNDGGGSGFEADESPAPFFASRERMLQRVSVYSGVHATAMAEIRGSFDANRGVPCLSALHKNLIYRVETNGHIAIGAVCDLVTSLCPVALSRTYLQSTAAFLATHCGPVLEETHIAYPLFFYRVKDMICGRQPCTNSILRKCFDLCDVTSVGYILKQEMRKRREAPEAETGDLTYVVASAVWRIFSKIAAAEEEKYGAGSGKGKRKAPKKGKKGAVKMPSQRQFHVNYNEFVAIMREDTHLVLDFLPFIFSCAVDVPMPPIEQVVAEQDPLPEIGS
jgi:hypothetical protein